MSLCRLIPMTTYSALETEAAEASEPALSVDVLVSRARRRVAPRGRHGHVESGAGGEFAAQFARSSIATSLIV